MRIIITEEQKKKLFIPRKIEGEGSRWEQWNKEQPIVDGERINQYTHDGKKQGIWEKYHSNGQLNYKGSFKDGKKEGYWESYWNNGKLLSKGSYKNDKKDGIWEDYYGNGKLKYRGSFKDGNRDGIWEEYYDDGQLWSKVEWNNDKYVKKLPLTESEESKKGKLFTPRKLSGENSRFIQWNKEQPIVDGVQINQYTHDGKKQGYWETYNDNGEVNTKGNYKDDKKDGYWEDEYDYGEVNGKGNYINDKKDGYWEYYWDNGGLYKQGSYKDGKKDGIWEEYFKDGEFWYEGEWNNGRYIRDIRI